MAIEIVDFPIKNGGSFHGKMLVHQRVQSFQGPAERSCRKLFDKLKPAEAHCNAQASQVQVNQETGGAMGMQSMKLGEAG